MRTNLIKNKPVEEIKKVESTDGMLDMVIAFDTTGSMFSYIEAVRKHITNLIPNLFSQNSNLKLGVVAFGDYCDMPAKNDFGVAYQVLDLTNDKNEVIKFVENARNTSGGDGDEFYELVIKKIVEETSWREGSTKAVLLIADANPHRLGYSYPHRVTNNKIDWREEARKAADKGIKFDTLRICQGVTWYEELSRITNGISAPFSSSNKTSQLIEAAALSRGGAATMDAYNANMSKVMASSDEEMKAVYTAYSKELVK